MSRSHRELLSSRRIGTCAVALVALLAGAYVSFAGVDLNNDGAVDFCDELLFFDDYFVTGNLRSDFNGDDTINFTDLALLGNAICTGNSASATSGSATIGVYFDAAGTINTLENALPFTYVDAYIVAQNVNADVGGFSAKIDAPGTFLFINDISTPGTFTGSNHDINHGVFEVGSFLDSCLVPASGTVVLRHFQILYTGGADFVLTLQGIGKCTEPSQYPSWVACNSCTWEYFDTNALGSAVINPRDINGNGLADVFEISDIRFFQILGNSSGIGWSMGVRSSTGSFASAENLNFAPVLPVNSPPSDFVAPITSWLQGLGFNAQPWYFDNRIFTVDVPAGSGFELGVDTAGVSPLTGGTSCWVTSATSCTFNPTLMDVTSSIASVPKANPLSVSNHPNPFNPSTTIAFTLPEASRVDLAIYDLGGRLVRTVLRDRGFDAGPGSVEWDGRNDDGAGVPTGVYLYRLVADGVTATGRMALIR